MRRCVNCDRLYATNPHDYPTRGCPDCDCWGWVGVRRVTSTVTDETGNVGETGEIEPGASETFTITIPAGHYVIMCNEAGHYEAGMHLNFTVN